MNEFSRIEELIGINNLNKINESRVLVLGVGGVGSVCATTLIRCGIKNIIIIDNDNIDITNINRQVMAFSDTIGMKKIDVLEKYLKKINSNINVIKIDKYIDQNNIDEVFNLDFKYAIDACDSINTKEIFIKKCIDNNKIFVSCMGTANKMDPEKLKIMRIDKTEYDPLSKKIRKWARDQNLDKKIYVVSSSEKVIKKDKLGTMSFVPNTAGILCAKYIIDKIINKID